MLRRVARAYRFVLTVCARPDSRTKSLALPEIGTLERQSVRQNGALAMSALGSVHTYAGIQWARWPRTERRRLLPLGRRHR